jgi:glycosyltransferase involved in cell wall biosynthesis
MPNKTSQRDELLTVVIPCLNEERTVGLTVDGIYETAGALPMALDVLIIDDGSADRTRARAEQLCARFPSCQLLVNPKNVGIGRSVLTAHERIDDRSWVTVIPGDNEFDFRSIFNFMAVRDRYDLILGYLQNPVIRPVVRRLASGAFTTVVNALYGFPYHYLNGMTMYRVEIFKGIEVVGNGHAFNAELVAKALLRRPDLRVGEVPFIARGRAIGTTNAFRPASVLRAVGEVYRGYRSFTRFRDQVIQGDYVRGSEEP